MSGEIELIGTFTSEDECAAAIEGLHKAHVHDFNVFSPFMSEKINEAVDEVRQWGRSPVRKFVLAGGFTGAFTGLILTVGTSWEWNIIAGGRPIAAIAPYIVIIFELMILFGVLSAVSSFFITSRLPAFESAPGYRTRFGADKFGLVARVAESDVSKVEAMLRDAGAEEVARAAA
jgi:hypothetical protein